MTDTQRARAERAAAEKYPKPGPPPYGPVDLQRNAYVSGWLDGKTVSAEQIGAAWLGTGEHRPQPSGSETACVCGWRSGASTTFGVHVIEVAFRAAGLRVEGEA